MAETTIHHILDELAEAATDHRDKGGKFERLIRAYLTTDPLYVSRYSDVWLWTDWPDRGGKGDTGIDLVAKERDTGAMVAIQCKFYAPSYTLQKGDIDSFFTASGKAPFASRLIVSTTDKWSKNAEDALDAQQIPCARLRVQDLEDSAVDWSKFTLAKPDQVVLRTKKKPYKHQQAALKAVAQGFKEHERGKLIMACGTGKTYTSLKVVEQETPSDGLVLFLVPSISLLSQTLKEWTAQATDEIRAFAVCSDTKVGKHSEDIAVHDLAFPATTDAKRLGQAIAARPKGDKRRTVIFSTYQSIDVISQAQKKHGLGDFDLIVCDEAHRTTGVTLADDEESAFVRVHDPKFLVAKHRLYMTATPRIYADESKSKAEEGGAEIASMDDETKFGPEFHRLGFGEAVSQGLLADYKVMVLAVDEKSVSKTFQSQLADENHELNLDDAVKIVGCWNGLSKRLATTDGDNTAALDPHPMRRAVAFARDIKASKHLANLFPQVVDQYIDGHDDEGLLRCEVEHVDGTYNVLLRNQKLDWLKEETEGNLCRILSNARCLSEGVDVPALDAVLFLNPRDSVVDVVQSVGRVMRRAEGKKYGYIILPIGVPADLTPEEALKDNKRYKVVWQVLQALRAHDDRFNALVNKIELNKTKDDQLQIIGVGGGPGEGGEGKDGKGQAGQQIGFAFPHLEEWRNAIYAKIVQKVGDRRYWENWANDVAKIAERHTARINELLEDPESKQAKAFARFLKGLKKNINPSIETEDAVEMLSQHLITKPVFEALFEGYSFAEHNPVSISIEKMIRSLGDQAFGKETESLDKFYASVRQRAKGIDNAEGKQKVIYELYETFFKTAFKKMADRLGIVYTPVQAVDFIIQSADQVLRKEFGRGLSDEGVHILDPFTGTGTFMVRLLQSGLIAPADAVRKFHGELHANELVLLAYYIAAINIEEAYHGLRGEGAYEPFDGIVLTDTFQLAEEDDQFEEVFPENNKRAARQKQTQIRVIIGNPPYSAQQESQNDNNKNIGYPGLDRRIGATYAAKSTAVNKKNLYDSYIRAIRWATNRIGDSGVIAFITNGSFLDANNMDGLRKCLVEEFSTLYIFNLRGNQRTSGEESRREGGKIFDSGSRTPVAISIMVKNPRHQGPAVLNYHDIGDYLNRETKLAMIQQFGSVEGMTWEQLAPNAAGDWINQRDPLFGKFIPVLSKAGENAIFSYNTAGSTTARDAWVYNFSRDRLTSAVELTFATYAKAVEKYAKAVKGLKKDDWPPVEGFIDTAKSNISWSRSLKADVVRGRKYALEPDRIVPAMYRPFTKTHFYFSRALVEYVYKQPDLFPEPGIENRVISASGVGANKPFTALMTDIPSDYEFTSKSQCLPLYYYEPVEEGTNKSALFAQEGDRVGKWRRFHAISDWALRFFREQYQDDAITKDDIFYYTYGVMSAPEYLQRFGSDLKKMPPRIPLAQDFQAFADAGRYLADLHVGYEQVEPYPLTETRGQLGLDPSRDLKVSKMRFGKRGKEVDKSSIVVNNHLTFTNLPEEVHAFQVNGKSALEWIMERYQHDTDKASGIVNDPNDWSTDPAYIVELIKRIVTVSVETMKIVKGLPALNEKKA